MKKHYLIFIFILILVSIFSPILINVMIKYSNNRFVLDQANNWSAQELYNPEWFSFFGNYLSFLGTIVLGIAAIWQNERIRKLEDELNTKQQESDKKNKAIEFSFKFIQEILPIINRLEEAVKHFGIEKLGNFNLEYRKDDSFPYKITKINQGEILSDDVKRHFTDLFNILETFSLIVINDIVDDSIIRITTSGPFLETISKYMIYFAKSAEYSSSGSFKPIFQLYFYWRYQDSRIKNLSQESLKHIFNFDDRDTLNMKSQP